MHYSRVTELPRLGRILKAQVREFARDRAAQRGRRRRRKAAIVAEMRRMWLRLRASTAAR